MKGLDTMDFYKCKECNNIMADISELSEPCKSADMELLAANTVDAAVEKHVPVALIDPMGVKIRVGSEAHPMLPEHYIEWIFVKTTFGGMYCNLNPGDPPEAILRLEPDEVESVYAYCNLHGLWKAREPVLPLTFDTNDTACSPEFTAGCVNPSAGKTN